MSFSPSMRHTLLSLIVILSAVIAIASYFQALHYPFISDDELYITNNSKLSGLMLSDLWRLFIEPYNPLEFLPLRDLSYWFDITLFGLTPAAFRLHNIALYVLSLPLVYLTTIGLWRHFRPMDAVSAPWAAVAVTALFALHPAHVEAVVLISSRKDVLSGLLSLLALWLAVKANGQRGFATRYAMASLIVLLAAMLSKATAVAVAPVISLIWVIFWRETLLPGRNRHMLLWSFASLLLGACVMLLFMTFSTVKEPAHFGIEIFIRAIDVLGWLGRLSISPESRHFFYPVFEDTKLTGMMIVGALILMVSISGVVMVRRKYALEWLLMITFVMLCLPYMQLIPFETFSLVSDRFLFLAVWPVAMLFVMLIWRLHPLLRIVMLTTVMAAFCYQTIERPSDWRSEIAHVSMDVAAYPGHYLPAFQKIWWQLRLGQYGDALGTANGISDKSFRAILVGMIQASYAVNYRVETTGRPDQAVDALQKFELALQTMPAQSKWNPSMRYVRDRAQYVLSLKSARLAERFPDNALVRYQTGLRKLAVGNYQDAVKHLRAALMLQQLPASLLGNTHKSIGVALLESKYIAEAEAPLHAALEQSPPDLQAYCLLSSVYKQTGRFVEAKRAEDDCHTSSKNSKMMP